MLLTASPAAAALVAPRPLVLAAGPSGLTSPAAVVQLETQAARLRTDLGKVNAEITALKRGDRGVRDDYRMRSRMADAEELARKLTAVEAELRRLNAPAAPAGAVSRPAAIGKGATPAEAPGVLEARADLLTDEARRLTLRAGTLERAADQLRNRQSLRRRAGHLERDPFAVMEGSKRFMVVPGAPATRTSGAPTRGTDTTAVAPGDNAPGNTGQENSTPPTGVSAPTSSPMPPTVAPPATPGSGPGATTAAAPNSAPQTTPQPTPTAEGGGATVVSDGRSPTSPGNLSAPAGGTSVAGSRALLDPDTAAELRRLDSASAAAGRPLNEVERLQQAAAILARKAQALESQARALRARAVER